MQGAHHYATGAFSFWHAELEAAHTPIQLDADSSAGRRASSPTSDESQLRSRRSCVTFVIFAVISSRALTWLKVVSIAAAIALFTLRDTLATGMVRSALHTLIGRTQPGTGLGKGAKNHSRLGSRK